jgi:predicted GNAT family N-acyltransferase
MEDALYAQEVELRTQILLAPLGLTIEDYLEMTGDREQRSEHFVAVVDHQHGERVVGAATLCLPGPDHDEHCGKVQQVCVNKQRQGEGIGTKLMIAIEARAFVELGLPGLYCHAQLSAMSFYERLGWSVGSEVFQEAGIDHKRMEIVAPRPEDVSSIADGGIGTDVFS